MSLLTLALARKYKRKRKYSDSERHFKIENSIFVLFDVQR